MAEGSFPRIMVRTIVNGEGEGENKDFWQCPRASNGRISLFTKWQQKNGYHRNYLIQIKKDEEGHYCMNVRYEDDPLDENEGRLSLKTLKGHIPNHRIEKKGEGWFCVVMDVDDKTTVGFEVRPMEVPLRRED